MIVCDKDKLDGKRCNGAPDFIIEIISPSNPSDDYIRKLYYYNMNDRPGIGQEMSEEAMESYAKVVIG